MCQRTLLRMLFLGVLCLHLNLHALRLHGVCDGLGLFLVSFFL